MDLYVIRRPSAWANLQELEAAGAKSAKIGNEEMSDRVRWIRSYVVKEPDGRFGSVCIYEARDPESIRAHARCGNARRSDLPDRQDHRHPPGPEGRERSRLKAATRSSARERSPCASAKAAPRLTARAA
jgi:uncharacterized protein DUF4242